MNLILDIGNTRLKLAVFDSCKIKEVNIIDNPKDDLKEVIKWYGVDQNTNVIISSVANEELTKFVIGQFSNAILLDDKTKTPIINKYKTPKTLGRDRLANAVGAYHLHPNSNTLVIDAGTCLKFDFINISNEYLGGSIAPGLKMRFKSLNTFTAKLPLIENYHNPTLIGQDTHNAILSGCYVGMNNEIEATINSYKEIYPDLNVLITGGDMQELQKMDFSQKNSIFAHRWLTMMGLNEILKNNA